MTISSTTNRVSYTTNGVTTAFAFDFKFFSTADLVVIETVTATGVQTTKTLGTDYTVSGTQDATGAFPSGGTVTAATAPATGLTWTILRDPSPVQAVQHTDNDPLPASSIDNPLDLLTCLVQRDRDLVSRALVQPDGDTGNIARLPAKVSRIGMFLGFDTNGDPTALAGTAGSGAAVSAAMQPVVQGADLATARTALGLGTASVLDAGTDADNVVQLDSDAKLPAVDGSQLTGVSGVPAGALMPYAGSTAPTGWLLADGAAVSRTTHADLFTAIGTTYGTGDGSTTFNVPDLGGRVPAGKEATATRLTTGGSGVDGATLGAAGGVQTVTLTAAQSGLPAHGHTASEGSHTHTVPLMSDNPGGGGSSGVSTTAGATSTATTSSSGGSVTVNDSSAAAASQAHSNTQPTIVLNYIIKT